MFLFVAIETSSFPLETVLVLFCVSAIDFSEYWKVDVHWIIGSRISIMVGASISIPAMVTMSMVPMMSQMLLFNLSWGSPFVTLATSSVTATSCGGPIDFVPCTNGIPPVARGDQTPLLGQLVD